MEISNLSESVEQAFAKVWSKFGRLGNPGDVNQVFQSILSKVSFGFCLKYSKKNSLKSWNYF